MSQSIHKRRSQREAKPSIEDLARQQRVTIPQDIQKIESLWPVGHDPDEFLKFILSERRERRKHARQSITA